MSSSADEFQPDQPIVDALLAKRIEPLVREIERELGAPMIVEGEVIVRDAVVGTWVVLPHSDGDPINAAGRASFRRTGGRHVLFHVQVMGPPLGELSWRGFVLEGWIHPARSPIAVEERSRMFPHRQDDWLPW